jgi:hypothetical protein
MLGDGIVGTRGGDRPSDFILSFYGLSYFLSFHLLSEIPKLHLTGLCVYNFSPILFCIGSSVLSLILFLHSILFFYRVFSVMTTTF